MGKIEMRNLFWEPSPYCGGEDFMLLVGAGLRPGARLRMVQKTPRTNKKDT